MLFFFFFFCPCFPGSPGIQSIKEMMDSGWPRSLFVVTNGFSHLRMKEAVVDTGRRGGHHSPRWVPAPGLCPRCPGEPSGLYPQLWPHPGNALPQADAFSCRTGTPVMAYIWHPRSHHKVGRGQSHTEKDVSVGMTLSKAMVSWVGLRGEGPRETLQSPGGPEVGFVLTPSALATLLNLRRVAWRLEMLQGKTCWGAAWTREPWSLCSESPLSKPCVRSAWHQGRKSIKVKLFFISA